MHLTPYATGAATKKGRGRGGNAAEPEDYELELKEDEVVAAVESDHSDNDDVTADTMIKVMKCFYVSGYQCMHSSSYVDIRSGLLDFC